MIHMTYKKGAEKFVLIPTLCMSSALILGYLLLTTGQPYLLGFNITLSLITMSAYFSIAICEPLLKRKDCPHSIKKINYFIGSVWTFYATAYAFILLKTVSIVFGLIMIIVSLLIAYQFYSTLSKKIYSQFSDNE